MGRTAANRPVLFLRKDSPNYWVRFTLKGQGQIRLALGTSDPAEAEKLAQREHQRAILRAEEGLLAVKSSFEKVAREYVAELKARVANGTKKPYVTRDYPPVIERYFIAYFGKRAIDGITSGDIHRYQVWRQSYWISGPGANTKHIEYERNGKKLYRPVKREVPTSSRLRGDRSGNRRSAYSFRHFYIKRQLLANVDVFTVAINTRTSVEMIQKYYVPEITPEHRATSLNPRWES